MADLKSASVKKFQENFLEEVANGNIEEVKNLLSSFEHFNFKNKERGYTALHLAALHKNLQILELLLSENKTNINARASCGETPLYLAVEAKHYEGCLRLIQAGADVNLTSYRSLELTAPLHLAAKYDSTNILELLLCQDNIDVNVKKANDENPLITAVRRSNFQAVALLVQAGANINATLRTPHLNGNTVLHIAVETDNQEILHHLLLQPDIKLDVKNKAGRTPLFLAVKLGRYHAAELLIQSGADVNVCGYNKDFRDSLLHVAVKNNDLSIVNLLLSQDNKIVNNRERPILFCAAKNHRYEILERFIQGGADLTVLDRDRQTPLHVCVNNPKCAHLLISHGVDLEVQDSCWGNTALHKAVMEGCLESVCMLLYYNADANAKNAVGRTPFMASFTYGLVTDDRQQILDILFDYNSDFHAYDNLNEENLIDLALRFNPRYFSTLLKRGSEITTDAFIACITSVYPDENYFKVMWDRLEYNEERPISLTMLFVIPGLDVEIIEKFINVVIESPNTDLLLSCVATPSEFVFSNFNDVFYCHQYGNLSNFSFPSFIRNFKRSGYDLNLLVKLIFRLLENSYQLTTEVVIKIFSYYGYCELIQLLRYQEIQGNWDSFSVSGMMVRVIFDIHTSIKDIRNNFLETYNPKSIGDSQCDINTYLAYFADRRVMSLSDHTFSENVIPEVPKLTELARNKSREFVVKTFHTRTTCQYYTIIDELKIPQLHKRILKFEQELYQVV